MVIILKMIIPPQKKWLEALLQADTSTPKMYINRYIQTLRALDIDTTNNKYLTLQKRNL